MHTVRYFCETFIQPVRVSFLHNYRTVLLNSIPYGTSSKPSFSPYGFHFYTTTVRSFECNTPKEYTVRYNTSLSPTRGGGSSPSGSIPRPSPLVTRARMCYHSLIISNLPLTRCRRHVNFRPKFSILYGCSYIECVHLHRMGFIFAQLPYGPRPLARSHALLPWSRVLACPTTVSPFPTCPSHDVMSTFECPKVLNPVRLLGTCTVRVSCHTVWASGRTFGSHLDINTVRCYTSNRTG